MSYIARINVGSGGRTGGVGDSREGRGALAGTCARARGIEGGDNTVRGAHVAVNHIARIGVAPFNRSCRVDAPGGGAEWARTRNIDPG